ncbi:MAG: diguanylate phosphodiesterase [unclassified Hahellaceae]|nr:diguanylate phosphodiesterase [Hahellaceae bacterium]|tara:strand:+ start:89670 stop:90428 length:759 start_codon:yes stop_codon:yes gene_type:complete
MNKPIDFQALSCKQCIESVDLGFEFTMAFQPIVALASKSIYGYEALCRGTNNESAWSVIQQVHEGNRYRFDQVCRVKAITLAAKLKMPSVLSINFFPNAVYKPELCIRTTLETARVCGFPIERILFEFTESEKLTSASHVKRIVESYREMGFKTATDDFGSGHSGLNLLADYQTDVIKFDMALVRNIDRDTVRQKIIRHCVNLCLDLGITPLAEGIETRAEMEVLQSLGIDLMQGYYFAKPGFECLPQVNFD